jgi:hypothetical protein
MRFGGDAGRIADPMYEPRWPGQRALVEVAAGHVAIREVDIGAQRRSVDLLAALAAATLADEVLLDGYLVPGPLPGTDAAGPPPSPAAEVTRGGLFRQLFLGSLARRESPASRAAEPAVDLSPDGPLVYVAVDLLWLDGEPLVDLPLGERKRLLESVLTEGDLVRRTVAVRPPAERWHLHWRSVGFEAMVVKGANSRYVPGGTSRDWAALSLPHA